MLTLAVLCVLPLLGAQPLAEKDLVDKGLAEKGLVPKGWPDEYIDTILDYLQDVIKDQGLDPADLPEEKVSFSETILGITFHGSAKVYNGKFSGLSTIHRNGDTDITLDENTLHLTANLAMNDASARYSAKAEFMDISIGASAKVDISSVDVYFDASMPLTPGAHLTLSQFEITHIGHISVDIDGLGPLDWILEILVDAIGNSIKGWLADLIEGPIRDLLQGLLDQYVPDIPSALL